ncbi:MAG: hypothetical protein M3Z35_04690 [Nitrospirota bacterium]|nr:hypothetical protein [Nitrospirota bacterium]
MPSVDSIEGERVVERIINPQPNHHGNGYESRFLEWATFLRILDGIKDSMIAVTPLDETQKAQ